MVASAVLLLAVGGGIAMTGALPRHGGETHALDVRDVHDVAGAAIASAAPAPTVAPEPVPATPGVAAGPGFRRPPVIATALAKPRDTGWRWPLIGPITQYFGQVLTIYGPHQGIDIDGSTGDPVVAAHAGRVVVAGDIGGCGGLQVQVDIGGGIVTLYHHLSSIGVTVGETVTLGQRIGRVGSTGCSTGSHLHFAVQVDGTFVDPLDYLPAR